MSSSPSNAVADLAEDARDVVVRANVAFRDERRVDRGGEIADALLDPLALIGEREPARRRRRAPARSPTRSSACSRRRARAPACPRMLRPSARSYGTLRTLAPRHPASRLLRGARLRRPRGGALRPVQHVGLARPRRHAAHPHRRRTRAGDRRSRRAAPRSRDARGLSRRRRAKARREHASAATSLRVLERGQARAPRRSEQYERARRRCNKNTAIVNRYPANYYEDAGLRRLAELVPSRRPANNPADRGFGDQKLFGFSWASWASATSSASAATSTSPPRMARRNPRPHGSEKVDVPWSCAMPG